jgi:hypothetical protein
MSPYITFKDQDKTGELQFYILQRDFPHYCAILSFHPIPEPMAIAPISGHNLWLIGVGTIRGLYIPSYQDTFQQFQATIESMASWFYSERILKEPKRYRKWLIPAS